MQNKLIVTADGSHTVINKDLNVSYHSMHGAIQESKHIFIDAGLNYKQKKKINILEVGFGTGLNALLTLIESKNDRSEIIYEAIELHPLDDLCISSLNYLSLLNAGQLRDKFLSMHLSPASAATKISDHFHLKKIYGDIRSIQLSSSYDLIYFDPFDPVAQPELWSVDIFKKIYDSTNDGGVLVTYSSKGAVRRAMEAAGFKIEKLPGPRGKREIVRATKN
ncbi:MAG: tRNA (5-methylaminomethyl-2-thiouridine)(34)-methyltransferase MnmD [Chitinophagaceae bacterium]|nr:tRNA (5-methylaminomethyl-2-thiouridine)(34)-methyltransferase MnmD [Chitinophagaceae bacterium]